MPGVQSAPITAGDLNKRVTLLQPVYNEWNDEIIDWTRTAEVWAAINPSFAQELNQGATTVEAILVPVVIRYRADINATWRLQDKERLYRIHGILDIQRLHVQLQLNCEELE